MFSIFLNVGFYWYGIGGTIQIKNKVPAKILPLFLFSVGKGFRVFLRESFDSIYRNFGKQEKPQTQTFIKLS